MELLLFQEMGVLTISLFEFIKKKNYSGWLVVEAEQDPIKANPFEYAKIGFKYLKKRLKNVVLKLQINDKEKLVHYSLQRHMAI